MNCRHCQHPLVHQVIDLGFAPPSNSYLTVEDLRQPELHFPLRVMVCDQCWLMQTEDFMAADALFQPDYAYFSSTSKSWLKHAKQFCTDITQRLKLNESSYVVEIASNDGYLLRNFVEAGIPCLGIEPTKGTADAAEKLGIPVLREFFDHEKGERLANEGKQADLICGNNVYAHVPNINDFTKGLKAVLKSNGTITLEFPHLMKLIEYNQFDTIYHEHYSYLLLSTVCKIFAEFGLRIWHVEELNTHGGSLRIFGCHDDDRRQASSEVLRILEEEKIRGLETLQPYIDLQSRAEKNKYDLLSFICEIKEKGQTLVGYGAAAKGNTLLNFAGVKSDLIEYVCDAAIAKQGKFLPGSHIPIYSPEKLIDSPPDYVLILPWNIANEVEMELSDLKKHGTRFVTFLPNLKIF